MRFGSVCSGIEAASVAFKPLGWEPAWLAEVDIAASAVLAHRLCATAPQYPLPGTETKMKRVRWGDQLTNWGDMTRLPELVRSGAAEAPDVLCGGTPCQGFSVAGLRGGLDDPRGQLTLSFVELADVIDDKRAELCQPPCVILWENVPGVRSDKGNAFGHFLAALVGVADPIEPGPRPEPGRSSAHWTWKKEAGQHIPKWPSAGAVAGPRRTAAWRSLDAQFFHLAQRRERVFVVASAREGFDPQAVLFESEGVRRDSAPSRETLQDVARTLAARTDGGGFPRTDEACSGYVQPVKRPGESAGRSAVIAMAHGQAGAEISEERCPTLTCNHEAPIAAYALTGFACYTEALPTLRASSADQGGGSELLISVFDPNQITSKTNRSIPTPELCHTLPATPNAPIAFSCKDYGADAIVDLAPTMRAMNHHESHASGGGGQIQSVMQDMAVRRLMPVECERLQGFPDGWTDVPVGSGTAADGPRYKQLGNSWAVPCVRWIGGRIATHVAALDAASRALSAWMVAP